MLAPDGSKSDTRTEDMLLLLLALIVVSSMIQKVPQFLQDKLGIDLGSSHLVAAAALSDDTMMGTQVNAANGAPFYANANDTDAVDEFAPGTSLVVVGGPVVRGGERWWEVEDSATGQRGWVRDSDLVQEGVGGVGEKTPLGAKARALMATSLWKLPGVTDKIGDMAKGTLGSLTDGPKEATGSRWWFFDQEESDEDGWVPESVLVLGSDRAWRTGSAVRATHDMDLFERAGGGRAFGTVKEEEEMKIVGGPELVGGQYWWLVETSDGTQGWVPESALEDGGVKGWVRGAVGVALTIAVVVTVVLLAGIVYATVRTGQIRAREAKRIREAVPQKMQPKRNDRWDKVLGHVTSDNPNDWRLAIIEADVMLDELVTRMGFLGTTLGDKLKQATRGDFRTIDAAWEAHKVRNQIAHSGSDFILTQRETKRVIGLYESVFDEFKYTD